MFDLAVIGLGPAGLEAVEVALKKGLNIVAFEKNELGGTCLNFGCVPTKALLYSSNMYSKINNCSKLGIELECMVNFSWQKMLDRKNDIVSKFNKVLNSSLSKNITLIKGEAEIWLDEDELIITCDDNLYKAKNILIATGSRPIELSGLEFDKNFILSSDDLFSLKELPKSITIVGSGAIGLEWAQIFSNLNVQVNIVEKAPAIAPLFDIDIQKRAERILKSKKVAVYKDDFIVSVNSDEIILNSGKKIKSEKILCAVGRCPLLPSVKVLGCAEEYKIKLIDNYRTDFNNLYVAGDATGGVMLAHCASFQAKEVIDSIICSDNKSKKEIPSVVYLSPEIASCGIKGQDIDETYTVKQVLLSRIAKAWCDDSSDGFVKLIIKNDEIKGAHLVCPDASTMIAFLAYFINNKVKINEIEDMIFPHPSYSELILEVIKNG